MLIEERRAMIAIGDAAGSEPAASPEALASRLADAVAAVLEQRSVETLCVEGGATAAALASRMGWTRLTAFPGSDLGGVAALRPVGSKALQVLVKPGSYPWPPQLWKKLGKEMV